MYICGKIDKDPEVSFSEKAQMSIARFTVAVDRIPKREGEPEADFLTVWHSIGKQSLWNSIGTVVCVWW